MNLVCEELEKAQNKIMDLEKEIETLKDDNCLSRGDINDLYKYDTIQTYQGTRTTIFDATNKDIGENKN